MAKAYLVAHAGAANPERELSPEEDETFRNLVGILLGSAKIDRLPPGRGGLGVKWVRDGKPCYLLIREGAVAVFFSGAPLPTVFRDRVGLEAFVRACLHEQIDTLSKATVSFDVAFQTH
jgi:hypothetical protein